MNVVRWLQSFFVGHPPNRTIAQQAHHEEGPPLVALSATPDKPESFGYKISWIAARDLTSRQMADVLELQNVLRANWTTGLAAAHSSAPPFRVFITPPISGWTLAIGRGLPYPIDIEASDGSDRTIGARFDALLQRIKPHSPETLFFATHRGAGLDAWARMRGARIERVFAFCEQQVLANRGEQTTEEHALGLPDLGARDPPEADAFLNDIYNAWSARRAALLATGTEWEKMETGAGRGPYPDELDTLNLAAAWSIDPRTLHERSALRGVGLAGILPTSIRI